MDFFYPITYKHSVPGTKHYQTSHTKTMTPKLFLQGITALALVFITINSIAQIINLYHTNASPQVGFSRAIANNSSGDFPV